MSTLAYALPRPARHRFAAWPVWRDSTTERVQCAALAQGSPFDRQTHTAGKHGGLIGRTALDVYYTLLFDFLDFKTGQLDPSYDAIAAKAGVCRRAVADALALLKFLGLLHWQRVP